MSKPLSPAAQQAIDAFRLAGDLGLSEADAWVAAKNAVGEAWTPSLRTVVSRHLQQSGEKTHDHRGGNQRDAMTQAVWARLRRGQQALRQMKAKAASELAIGLVQKSVNGQMQWVSQWMELQPESRQRAQAAERLLTMGRGWAVAERIRKDGPVMVVVRGNRHELDCAVIAPVVAAAENRRRVAGYWERILEAARRNIMVDIRFIMGQYPHVPSYRKDALRTRAERVLWGDRGPSTASPVVASGCQTSTAFIIEQGNEGQPSAWLVESRTGRSTAVMVVDLFADDDEEDGWVNTEPWEHEAPVRATGPGGSHTRAGDRRAWQAARHHQ